MILKRYGATVESVEAHFEARALTEVAFRRDGRFRMPASEFFGAYERVGGRDLGAEREGPVQVEVEEGVLRELERRLERLLAGLGAGQVLLVESAPGADYPKLREERREVVVGGRNRLHFRRWIDPPLRMGVYRRRGAAEAPGPAG